MHLIGIPLRKPSFNELTAATMLGTGLWVAVLGVLHAVQADTGRDDAVALLLVCVWGSISARLGIHLDKGGRHVAANALVSGLLVGGWQVAASLLA